MNAVLLLGLLACFGCEINGSPIEVKSLLPSSNFLTPKSEESVRVVEVDPLNYTASHVELSRFQLDVNIAIRSMSVQISPTLNTDTFNGILVLAFVPNQGGLEELVLHTDGLEILEVTYGFTIGSAIINVNYIATDEFLTVIFEEPLNWVDYYLRVVYSGTIRNDGVGVYRASYTSAGITGTYVAMNGFPTHARKVFPCIDEPQNKINLELTVERPASTYTTLSNSPAIMSGVITAFAVTQDSPTYAISFLMSEFLAHATVNWEEGVLLTIYGARGLNAQAQYPAMIGAELVTLIGQYTEMQFHNIFDGFQLNWAAMPDQVHEPQSYGVIPVWEPYLFMSDQSFSEMHRHKLLKTMAVDAAKQWFSFVVTPSNWVHYWMTNGLSTFVGYEIANQANPELAINDHALVDYFQQALLEDSKSTSTWHSLNGNYIYNVDDVAAYLDSSAPLKGAALFRMFQYVVGPEILQMSLQHFLNNNKFGAVTEDRLYSSINGVLADDEMEHHIQTADQFFDAWINSPGYPVLTVSLDLTNNVVVTQQRFSLVSNVNNFDYPIPLTWTTRSTMNFDELNARMIMHDFSTTIDNLGMDEEEWIIVNLQQTGFYRVNYGEDLWFRLLLVLGDEERRDMIHPLNRAQMVNDAVNLARAGILDWYLAMNIVSTIMIHETDYPVWKTALNDLDYLRKRFLINPEISSRYNNLLNRLVSRVAEEIGFDDSFTMSETQLLTRGMVMEYACQLNHGECVDYAMGAFEENMLGVPATLRPAVYCTAVRNGADPQTLWMLFLQETVYWERLVILESLACSLDPDWINLYLANTITASSGLRQGDRAIVFKAVVEKNVENVEIALDFLQQNYVVMRDLYGGDEYISECILTLADNLSSEEQLDSIVETVQLTGAAHLSILRAGVPTKARMAGKKKLRLFVNMNSAGLEGALQSASQALVNANENFQWYYANEEMLEEWFNENGAAEMVASVTLLLFTSLALLLRQ